MGRVRTSRGLACSTAIRPGDRDTVQARLPLPDRVMLNGHEPQSAVTLERFYDIVAEGRPAEIDAALARFPASARIHNPVAIGLRAMKSVTGGDIPGGDRAAEARRRPLRRPRAAVSAGHSDPASDQHAAHDGRGRCARRGGRRPCPSSSPRLLASRALLAARQGNDTASAWFAREALDAGRAVDNPMIVGRVLQRTAPRGILPRRFRRGAGSRARSGSLVRAARVAPQCRRRVLDPVRHRERLGRRSGRRPLLRAADDHERAPRRRPGSSELGGHRAARHRGGSGRRAPLAVAAGTAPGQPAQRAVFARALQLYDLGGARIRVGGALRRRTCRARRRCGKSRAFRCPSARFATRCSRSSRCRPGTSTSRAGPPGERSARRPTGLPKSRCSMRGAAESPASWPPACASSSGTPFAAAGRSRVRSIRSSASPAIIDGNGMDEERTPAMMRGYARFFNEACRAANVVRPSHGLTEAELEILKALPAGMTLGDDRVVTGQVQKDRRAASRQHLREAARGQPSPGHPASSRPRDSRVTN